MKSITFLFIFVFTSYNLYSQIFAPNNSNAKGEMCIEGVEITPDKYAFLLYQQDSLYVGTSKMEGRIILTDAKGNVLNDKTFADPPPNKIYARNLLYKNNTIYMMSIVGDYTGGSSIAEMFRVGMLDTNLNVLNEKNHRIGDSINYLFDSYSSFINDKIYTVHERCEKRDVGYGLRHPVIHVYDLNGDLVRTKEIDTSFFPVMAGENDYAAAVFDVATNNIDKMYLPVIAGKRPAFGSPILENYFLVIDTNLTLTTYAKVACLNTSCATTIVLKDFKLGWLSNDNIIAGGIIQNMSSQYDENGLVRFNIPTPPHSGNYLYTNDTLSFRDSLQYGIDDVKYSGRKNIAITNHKLFFVSHDFFYFVSPFSPYNNTLGILSTDTSLNKNWLKRIGGDAYYIPGSVLATSDGGCIVMAMRYDQAVPNNQWDHYIFKIDSTGTLTNISSVDAEPKVVSVYPNPTSEHLHFDLKEFDSYIVTINDMSGKQILKQVLTGSKQTVNISMIPIGIYNYVVENKKGRCASGIWMKE